MYSCDGIDRIFLRKRGKITVGIKTIVAPDAKTRQVRSSLTLRLQDHLIPILHILHFSRTQSSNKELHRKRVEYLLLEINISLLVIYGIVKQCTVIPASTGKRSGRIQLA